jgi:1,4-dihydroxy-2-naphthoyl-CoA hydrolase
MAATIARQALRWAAMTATDATTAEVLTHLPPSALDERMGIEVIEASRERVVARMPVAGNTQPLGLLHGGASCVIAESVGSIGASIHGSPTHYASGVEINCSHHRGVREGWVTATATPIRVGKQIATFHVEIVDEQERSVATARLTCLLRPVEADDQAVAP